MGIKKLIVEFDNPVKSFFPGQNVSGKLTLVTNKRKTVQGLTLRCMGKAKVRWRETVVETTGKGRERKEERKTVVYQNDEEYFDHKFNPLGNGGEKVNIPSGTNVYNFNFLLPLGLPSSYVGKFGQVFYHLEAKLSRNGKHDLVTKVPFTVNGILDLNKEPGTIQSVEQRKYKYLCCLCCRNGPIGFILRLPKKGFVSGELIRFVIEMNNQSSNKIRSVTLALAQTVLFYVKGNSNRDSRIIRKIRGPQVEPGDDIAWEDSLSVPPIAPTRLGNCQIIDVQYSIQVEMDLSGFAKNLKGEVPIIIGTIPLRQNFYELSQIQNSIPEHTSQVIQSGLTATAPLFDDYPDLPPPTYTQAMAMEPLETDSKRGEHNIAYKVGKAQVSQQRPIEEDSEDEMDSNYLPTYITYGFNAA